MLIGLINICNILPNKCSIPFLPNLGILLHLGNNGHIIESKDINGHMDGEELPMEIINNIPHKSNNYLNN